jgi:hypothetical protein
LVPRQLINENFWHSVKGSSVTRAPVSGLDMRLEGIGGDVLKLFKKPRKVTLYSAQRHTG